MNSIARPRSRRSSSRIAITSACVVTSSAVVGSSARSSRGSVSSAAPIMTRWSMPPDSSCGYCAQPALAVLDADLVQHLRGALASLGAAHAADGAQRLGHEVADACAPGWCARGGPGRRPRPRPGTAAARRRAASARRARRRSRCPRPGRRAAGGAPPRARSSTCRSPTLRPGPTASPAAIASDTPRSTARCSPSTGSVTSRFSISSSDVIALTRLGEIGEALAEQVDGNHDDDDAEARRQRLERVAREHAGAALRHHHAPVGLRRLHAEADERDGRQVDHRVAEQDRALGDHEADDVGHQVPDADGDPGRGPCTSRAETYSCARSRSAAPRSTRAMYGV